MSKNNDNQITRFTSVDSLKKPMKPGRLAMSGLIIMTLALNVVVAESVDAAPNARPPFPSLRLPEKARGQEALQALGDKLPEVAAHYRMTPEKLTQILQKDRNAWLDKNGRLLFIDDFPPLPANVESSPTDGPVVAAAPYPAEQTFLLHSKPGSQRVIYLDFTGHNTTGTAWNSGTINADAYDLDGDPRTFNSTEQERIQYIWQRVAEDYAPFDVDVTTEEPAPDILNRLSSSDQQYGTRAVITRNNFGACTSCGGIAYVGVFDYYSPSNPGYYQPAWVFFDALGSGNEKYVAEAISHEVGHNLGLSHDGTSSVGYYQGHGTGATGWAPIMGVGYHQSLVQWSKGEYAGANNTEDDVAVIQLSGAALRNDDAGSSMAGAAALMGTPSGGLVTVNQGGLIERSTDQDYFSFSSGTGPLQITVTPDARSPNLDASIELFDAGGNSLGTANPPDTLGATINADILEGGYYLKIKGVGKGDPATGYSDYGSLGHYTISGSYPASNAVAPVAVASANPTSGNAPLVVGFSSNGSADPDGVITGYYWDFGDGFSSTEANPLHTYNTAGVFNPVLTVTDSQGLKDSAPLTINVAQNPLATTLHIESINLTTKITSKRYYQCVASVTVNNHVNNSVGSATVSGKWTGVTTSSIVRATTNSSGMATFTSAKTTSRGTCTFTVSGVTLTGYTYDPAQNGETSDSLTY